MHDSPSKKSGFWLAFLWIWITMNNPTINQHLHPKNWFSTNQLPLRYDGSWHTFALLKNQWVFQALFCCREVPYGKVVELEKRKWRTPVEILCDEKSPLSSADLANFRENSAQNQSRNSSSGKNTKSSVSINNFDGVMPRVHTVVPCALRCVPCIS